MHTGLNKSIYYAIKMYLGTTVAITTEKLLNTQVWLKSNER